MSRFLTLVTPLCILACMIGSIQSSGQAKNAKGDFIVDYAPFTPPEQDMMTAYIGKKATNFMASDLDGKSWTLSALLGKNVVLGFWSVDDVRVDDFHKYMDIIQEDKSLMVLSYCYEDRAMLQEYVRQRPIKYAAMPLGKFISEMGYAHDLGSPRIFFIDHKGIIKDIIPASFFENNQEGLPYILNSIEKSF